MVRSVIVLTPHDYRLDAHCIVDENPSTFLCMRGEIQVVRGTVGDQPWGWTLGALGVARRTVEVTLRSDDRVYRIVFDRGSVVAASSPLAVDTVTRIALTNHFIAPIQVNEIKRCLLAAPSLDELDVLAAAAHLDPDQTRTLRARVITQRAARTFAIDSGEFEIEDRVEIPSAGLGVDVRSVIFMGARMNLSQDRLLVDLRQFGARVVLKPGVFEDLDGYGFSPAERPILESLRSPTSLAELEANHREIDPRITQVVLYALGSCNALAELDLVARAASEPDLEVARTRTPHPLATPRTATLARGELVTERVRPRTQTPATSRDRVTGRVPTISRSQPMPVRMPAASVAPVTAPVRTRTLDVPGPIRRPSRHEPDDDPFNDLSLAQGTPSLAEAPIVPPAHDFDEISETEGVPFEGPLTRTIASLDLDEMLAELPRSSPQAAPDIAAVPEALPDQKTARAGDVRAMIETFKTGKLTTVRPNALKAHEVVALIEERTALLARGANHFRLLGIAIDAPIEDIHAAYVELSRNLDPKRLAALGISDHGFVAERLLAQVGIAFTVLTDRIRRTEYIATLTER